MGATEACIAPSTARRSQAISGQPVVQRPHIVKRRSGHAPKRGSMTSVATGHTGPPEAETRTVAARIAAAAASPSDCSGQRVERCLILSVPPHAFHQVARRFLAQRNVYLFSAAQGSNARIPHIPLKIQECECNRHIPWHRRSNTRDRAATTPMRPQCLGIAPERDPPDLRPPQRGVVANTRGSPSPL